MGYILLFIVIFIIPWHLNNKEKARKREEMYNNLNKKSVDEMEKWRR